MADNPLPTEIQRENRIAVSAGIRVALKRIYPPEAAAEDIFDLLIERLCTISGTPASPARPLGGEEGRGSQSGL